MATVVSSLTSAVKATFGIVETVATQTNNLVATSGRSVGMLNRYIDDAAKRQEINSAIDMDQFLKEARAQAQLNRSRAVHEIHQELKNNPELATIFASAEMKTDMDNLMEKLVKIQASWEPSED